MSDPAGGSDGPVLISSTSGLAAAHGPGVTISQHGGPYPFLAQGAAFVKYHQQPGFLNHCGRRLVFYQHNHIFLLKPGVARPRPGEERQVDPQYQAPLTNILAVQAGKHGRCFTQSKQARAVAEERAWSLLVRRQDGREEHVDLEAASGEERDKWVHALQSIVATAKRTELERDAKVRVVDVAYLVDQHGQVAVSIAPAAAAGGPLTVATGAPAAAAATDLRARSDDDTPSPHQPHSPQPAAATDRLSTAGVAITEAANSAPAQRSTATSTSGLEAEQAGQSKLAAALEENERLKERIAELEEMLKGTRVDSVPAS